MIHVMGLLTQQPGTLASWGPFMFFRRRNQRREILFDHKNDERSDR